MITLTAVREYPSGAPYPPCSCTSSCTNSTKNTFIPSCKRRKALGMLMTCFFLSKGEKIPKERPFSSFFSKSGNRFKADRYFFSINSWNLSKDSNRLEQFTVDVGVVVSPFPALSFQAIQLEFSSRQSCYLSYSVGKTDSTSKKRNAVRSICSNSLQSSLLFQDHLSFCVLLPLVDWSLMLETKRISDAIESVRGRAARSPVAKQGKADPKEEGSQPIL